MTVLEFDKVGERRYETGVDRGVLYPYDKPNKKYGNGVVWNGLTSVQASPSGAEPSPIYADNIKYLTLMSAEEFGGTIEAYTYPDEFAECDGSVVLSGVSIGQQSRSMFGFSYRTRIGNDIEGDRLGHKIHVVYGALAQPSESSYATVNESPEAVTFSWTFSTTPVSFNADGEFKNLRPVARLTFDSTKISEDNWAKLEATLYGSESTEATLPAPDELLKIVGITSATESTSNTNQ